VHTVYWRTVEECSRKHVAESGLTLQPAQVIITDFAHKHAIVVTYWQT